MFYLHLLKLILYQPNHFSINTVECHHNAVQYDKILHKWLQELRENINQMLDPQKTPHNLNGQTMGCVSWVIWIKSLWDIRSTRILVSLLSNIFVCVQNRHIRKVNAYGKTSPFVWIIFASDTLRKSNPLIVVDKTWVLSLLILWIMTAVTCHWHLIWHTNYITYIYTSMGYKKRQYSSALAMELHVSCVSPSIYRMPQGWAIGNCIKQICY